MIISAIFLAGGQGTRMQAHLPKQYLPLQGKTLALYSLETLAKHPQIFEIIIVCEKQYQTFFKNICHAQISFAAPGFRRQDSLFNGLQQVSRDCQFVCVHDSARPFLTFDNLEKVLQEAGQYGAATLATPLNNSVKEVCTKTNSIKKTVDRDKFWEMQTPQVASISLLKQGFAIANAKNLTVTDDNALIELTGHTIKLVKASPHNFKVTSPEDLRYAEFLLQASHVSI